MSQELYLEEGTARQISGAETNTSFRNLQRSLRSGGEIQGIKSTNDEAAQSCNNFVAKCLLDVKKILDPRRPYGYWIFLISCVMVISVDPLFFYVPVFNFERHCLGFDRKLRITSIVLHSIFGVFYLTYVNFLLLPISLPKIGVKSFSRFSLIDLLVVLPLPLVLLTSVVEIPKLGISQFTFPMNLFFLQYLLRVIRIYTLFTKATRISGILAEANWGKAAFNLLLYLHGGHVFGALWYFFAVERETLCWKLACEKDVHGFGCSSFYCDETSGDGKWFIPYTELCRGEGEINFGVFDDAAQSRIVEATSFVMKFPYCLRWGLQSLSNFGQSLQPSTYAGENTFVISITIYSLVLFVLFIGNVQEYLKSETVKSENVRQKEREIEQWMSSWKLSEELQREVKKYQPHQWQQMKDVNVENLLNNLPKDISKTIKQELCLKLLKKAGESEKLNEAMLIALCDYVKPVSYSVRTHIVREGDPIDEMLFVMQGKLRIYTCGGIKTRSPSNDDRRNRKNHHLRDGEFCGEELIAWFQADPYSSDFPTSNRTIQALTDVEAFVLTADDLQNFFIKHQAVNFIQLYWRFRRIWHSKRNAQTSTRG